MEVQTGKPRFVELGLSSTSRFKLLEVRVWLQGVHQPKSTFHYLFWHWFFIFFFGGWEKINNCMHTN